MEKNRDFENIIYFYSDELKNELETNISYLNYNLSNQNGEKRKLDEIQLKVAISNLLETKLQEYLEKKLNIVVEKNQFNEDNNNLEIADFVFNFNNVSYSSELRTSDIQNYNRQKNCSLIGSYKNNVKKMEPEKDIYFQIFWNQNFNFIKNNINKSNIVFKFNLAAFALNSDFNDSNNNFNLNQNQAKYNIIKPITKARMIKNIEKTLYNYEKVKTEEIKKDIGFDFKKIIKLLKDKNLEKCFLLKNPINKNYFIRIINKNNLSFDIKINNKEQENKKGEIQFYIDNSIKVKFNFINPLSGKNENGFQNFINIIQDLRREDIKHSFKEFKEIHKKNNKKIKP